MNTRGVFFALLRSAICGEKLNDDVRESLKSVSLATLFKLGKHNDLAHLLAYALEKNGMTLESDTINALLEELEKAKLRYDLMNSDYKEICQALNEAKIPYIPLKGAIIREYYYEPWMRTSCDIDILVREDELERAVEYIKNKCSYKTDGKVNFHDISLFSPFGTHLELHHNIRENIEKYDKILDLVWENSHLKDNMGYCFYQSNEFLMFHIISHCAYHFSSGGCGIKPIMDLWILRQKLIIDEEKLNILLKEASLTVFYSKIQELISYWFENMQSPSEIIKEMERFILLGGVYGTKEQKIAVNQAKKGGKLKYFFSRVFLPYNKLIVAYPIVKKHKVLVPFCQIARWFSAIFRIKRVAKEFETATDINESDSNKAKMLLDALEL